MHYNIEETSISNLFISISTHHDIEETSISIRFLSISTHHDIEETSISKCKTSILVYTDIEDFLDIDKCSFDIYIRCQSFFIRYRMSCSSISVFLCLVCCSSCSFRDTHCRVHDWPASVAYAGPAACNDAKFKFGDDGPVRSQHRPQPPERGSAAGAAAAAAGAGINGTQERVILGDKN